MPEENPPAPPPPVTLGIATMILPRMEVGHLEEWLTHLQRHGVCEVWIFLDDEKRRHHHDGWGKFPQGDQRLDLEDEDCLRQVQQIVWTMNSPAFRINLLDCTSEKLNVGQRQSMCCKRLVMNMRAGREFMPDWLCFLDVDEMLVVRTGGTLLEYLGREKPSNCAITMPQRLCDSRWVEGKAIPMGEITRHFGLTKINPKVIFRPNKTRIFSVHRVRLGKKWQRWSSL